MEGLWGIVRMRNLLTIRPSFSCFIDGTFSFCFLTERLWVPSGSLNGGRHAWSVLHHGPAMVCGCHRPFHHSCQQPETGIRMFSSRRTTQISWHSRTKGYWAYDFYSHGIIGLYDQHSEGNGICFYEFERKQNMHI